MCNEKCTDCEQTEYTEFKVYNLSWMLQDQNPVVNTYTTTIKLLKQKVKSSLKKK